MASQQEKPKGPGPYAPQTASLGGLPSVIPDVPITAVFLLLYVIFGAMHFVMFKENNERGHKFGFSGAMFGFCNIRIATMSLRIAWACHPHNINIGIAAQMLVYVGTVILFIMNWFFAQRIVRAQHPHWGWSTPYRIFHRAALILLIACLLLLIVAALQAFFTLSPSIHHIDRSLQLAGSTYFAAFAFAPIIVVFTSLSIPRRQPVEKFGTGRMRTNITILLLSATVLSLGAAFRAGIAYLPPVPIRSPSPWYFSRACFYIFDFLVEILVVVFYAWVRFDLRFHIPNGAKGPGSYSRTNVNLEKSKSEPQLGMDVVVGSSQLTLHMYPHDIFDDKTALAESLRYPDSTLSRDAKTGNWKIKRSSTSSYGSDGASTRYSHMSAMSLWRPDKAEVTSMSDGLLNGLDLEDGPGGVKRKQNQSGESQAVGTIAVGSSPRTDVVDNDIDLEKGDEMKSLRSESRDH
ncbi:hypothetical protein K432DRAFT_110550 [Lepidopterella palustris CBS 459.81]|uniref:Uncharacterized protein n=1 Tax=Lepidopterella palustris CBS 459.81 TaxID=1314670 RepID=A0A8E2EMI6_9PEZI|nr:hypothetical protein K432DRAFT_110550 [Lepidopterella palustris CBS 459.81]